MTVQIARLLFVRARTNSHRLFNIHYNNLPPAVANRLQGAVRKLINNKRITYISTSLIEYLPVLVTDRRISFSLQIASPLVLHLATGLA